MFEHRVQLARPDGSDQHVDDLRQLVHRPGDDPGLALLELQHVPPNANEEDDLSLLIGPPPPTDLLLDFDDGFDAVLLTARWTVRTRDGFEINSFCSRRRETSLSRRERTGSFWILGTTVRVRDFMNDILSSGV